MSLTLAFDEPDGEAHCDVCYEAFALPLSTIEEIEGNKIVCSRCKCERMLSARIKHLTEEHHLEMGLPPPICECGFPPDRCRAESCTPGKPATTKQGKLF